jgi:hypothetical protein
MNISYAKLKFNNGKDEFNPQENLDLGSDMYLRLEWFDESELFNILVHWTSYITAQNNLTELNNTPNTGTQSPREDSPENSINQSTNFNTDDTENQPEMVDYDNGDGSDGLMFYGIINLNPVKYPEDEYEFEHECEREMQWQFYADHKVRIIEQSDDWKHKNPIIKAEHQPGNPWDIASEFNIVETAERFITLCCT